MVRKAKHNPPQIIRHIGTLEHHGAFSVELNIVKFFDNPPAYDIRRWWRSKNGYVRAGRHGIQLSDEQTRVVKAVLDAEFNKKTKKE